MKSTVTPVVLALLLLVAGGVSWTLGEAEERIARAKTEVAMMEYGTVADDTGELDRSLGYARRVPALGGEMADDAKEARATAAYWLGRYDAVDLERDAGGALVEHDPRVLLLAANAGFRSIPVDAVDRQTYLQVLGALIRNYSDVLKATVGNAVNDASVEDVAYNYEFVVRRRDALAKTRPGTPSAPPAPPGETQPPSIHGRPGGPPKASDATKFKIVVPKRSDERGDNPEGGQGQQKIRKG